MSSSFRLFRRLILGGIVAFALSAYAGAVTYTTLYSFNGGSDGTAPSAALVNAGGILYGTTRYGGAPPCANSPDGCGTVFAITSSGNEHVVYAFKGGNDGASPLGDLIDVSGTLYGTTVAGGTCPYKHGGCGTVFAVTTAGVETVMTSFLRNSGSYPEGGLVYLANRLYGTASSSLGSCGNAYCGGIFWVNLNGIKKFVYGFKGGNDGYTPESSLLKMGGLFYGTTVSGGGGNCGSPTEGCGTVFSVSPQGVETVLYAFKGGGADGSAPLSGLIKVGGALYGTTVQGGARGYGTVFKVTTSGTETVLHSFAGGADGAAPQAGLVYLDGKLYGTTASGGGAQNSGTVFSVTLAGKERVVHAFAPSDTSSDGSAPVASLINVSGTLYGTTAGGGAKGYGTVFALTP